MLEEDASPSDRQAALLAEWVDARRQAAAWEAKSAALLADRLELMEADAATVPLQREAVRRSMIAEYSAAGRIAKGSVEQAFAEALLLREDFPALRAAFEGGAVSSAHVREIIRAADPVREAVRSGTVPTTAMEVYEAAALECAEREAPARTRAHVRELAAALAGRTVTERHRDAAAERFVRVRPIDDQMSLLEALLPTEQVAAIMDRLTQMARHQKTHPEDREPTLPPLDPDAFLDDVDEPDSADGSHEAGPSGPTSTSPAGGEAIFGSGDTFTIDPFFPGEPSRTVPYEPEWSDIDDPDELDAWLEEVDRIIAAGPQPIQIPTDQRTMDQQRADLLSDLLLAADPSSVHGTGLQNITARIQVTIAATTLAGGDDRPGMLDGHGTINPDTARTLAGMNAGWTRLFLDPAGMVTCTDSYTPTAAMKRFLAARDQHCRFPGCRMPVHRCDLDHTLDYALGGATDVDNLAHLCRAHHALKHPDVPDDHRWTVRQLPDWSLEWTSPQGRTHRDTPARRVMFVPSDELENASAPGGASPGGPQAGRPPAGGAAADAVLRRRLAPWSEESWRAPTGQTSGSSAAPF